MRHDSDCSRAARALPKARSDLVLVESRLLVESRQYEEAYRVLDAALADLPDDTGLLYESALMAERNGKFEVLERNLKLIETQARQSSGLQRPWLFAGRPEPAP